MNRVERQQRIVELVNEEKKVLAKDLATKLKVSEDTIRRDLRELDQKKLIRRIHSGAIQVGPPETMFQYRVNSKTLEKKLLAKKTVSLIHEGSVILVDGGTSNLAFAKALPKSFRATIITNSPPVVMALEMHQNLEIIVLGGTLNHKYMVNMGSEVANKVAKIRPDYYLMGMYNIDVSAGLTVPTFEESLLKKQMAEVATETISLATSDKLDTISTYVIGPINMLDTMITTVKDTEAYVEAGIKVLYCEDDE